jgi:hypothetical protein
MPPSVLVCLDDPTLGAGGLRKRIGLTGGVSVSKMEIRAPWVS